MKELRFEGHSDDTFGEYGFTNDDYDNCASGKPIRWAVEADGYPPLMVVGQHCPEPAYGWMIGVASLDDLADDPEIPHWPMRFEQTSGERSPTLVIEAPDDVRVICLERESDSDD